MTITKKLSGPGRRPGPLQRLVRPVAVTRVRGPGHRPTAGRKRGDDAV
ncbi:MAG: hypothetical protein ABTR54_13460 [Candidatus Competibacter sp.]